MNTKQESRIKNQGRGFFRSKFIKFAVIPLLLLALWFGLTCLYIIKLDTAFSLLSFNLPKTAFTHLQQEKLQKGNFVSGEFLATENNLGILSFRFETFFRPAYRSEDVLLFQIKEKDSKDWYYQGKYNDGLVYEVPFFPFGFPIIQDSKGKTYEFRITSLKGDEYNSVAVSRRWQNIAAKYKFNKHEILQNNSSFLEFSVKKFTSSFESIDVLFSSFVYLLPFLFYLILLSPLGKYFEKPLTLIGKKFSQFGSSAFLRFLLPSFKSTQRFAIIIFDSILLIVVLIDGLYLRLGNDFVYLLVPILWIFIQRYFGFTSKKTFVVALSFLLFAPVFLQFSLGQIAENMAVWAYLFLVAGTVQILIELKTEN
jgi:hypothetical protein